MTETSPRQDRDILGEFFSGAWAAPGRLIHVRPQAYRYWGIRKENKQQKKTMIFEAQKSSPCPSCPSLPFSAQL